MFKRFRAKSQNNQMSESPTREFEEIDNQTKYNRHSDVLPTFQNELIRRHDVEKASDRALHTKANPMGNKFTYGLVKKLLNKPPKYFMYSKPDVEDLNNPEELTEMDVVHQQWQEVDMYTNFMEAFAQGLGVNMSCIVKSGDERGFEKFLVFNTSHVKDYWRDPLTREVVRIEFNWPSSGGGKINGSNKDMEETTIMAEIGVNSVLFIPLPDVNDVFGRSDLLAVWNMIVYRALNRYYSLLYNKKGGIASRVLLGPDSISDTWRRRFEREAIKGIESELIELLYPAGLATSQNDPSKMVQWIENQAGGVIFEALDTMLSKDSAFPPQFSEGVETGALGGQAPVEENKTINKVLMSYIGIMNKLVKDINTTFFKIENKDYIAIPYMMDETNPMEALLNGEGKPGLDEVIQKKENPKEEKAAPQKSENSAVLQSMNGEATFTRKAISANSANAPITYIGNLWEEGAYKYGDKINYIDANAIMEYVNNPFKTHEKYLSLEHPSSVDSTNAVGKLRVIGTQKVKGKLRDKTEITFKPEHDPKAKVIKLSPKYSHGLEIRGDKIHQVDIDLLDAGVVINPRSELTGLETIAIRQED